MDSSSTLVQRLYLGLKQELFDFQLLPGDKFTESSVGERYHASRTPVREALKRLEKEGFLQMKYRAGWMVRPFEFRQFHELYELRALLETASVRRLGETGLPEAVRRLADVWMIPPERQETDGARISQADEAFHRTLVDAAGNGEISRLHQEVTERIWIVRRLGYATSDRLTSTYDDHRAILEALYAGRASEACALLDTHIAANRAMVESITLARLEAARASRPLVPPHR